VSDSNFSHEKIPSIVNRLMCFLFPVYYKGIISQKLALFYPALTGSKTPTSKFGCKAKKLGGRSTAR
ncbi:hypothetical protein E0M25_28595, partial [Bacillus mycoides]